MSVTLKVALGGFLTLILLIVVFNALGFVNRFTDQQTVTSRYEQFFDKCASVQSLESQRDRLDVQLSDAEDDDERERLRSARTAVEAQRDRTIDQYNADATALTRRQFQSADLPARLDKQEEHTQCAD